MKVSRFLIVTKSDEGDYLIYNTVNTAFVAIEENKYNQIFIEHNFSDNEIVGNLYKMGILLDDTVDELEHMRQVRIKGSADKMPNVTILTTTDCNARCFYCFEQGIAHYDMTRDVQDATVDYIRENFPDKILGLGWFGGEPLMNFEAIKYIIGRLNEYGYKTFSHVTTNGSLINDEILQFAKDNSFTSFQVTIDGVDKDYGRIKKYTDISADNAYERVIVNVCKLLQYGFQVQIRINFVASKVDTALKTFKKIHTRISPFDKGNLYIYLSPLTLHDEKENICNLTCEGEHPFMKVTKFQFEQGFPLNAFKANVAEKDKLLIGLNLMPMGFSCGMAMKNRIVIDADGKLYKCHRLVGKSQYSCGNVFDGLVKNEIYNAFISTELKDEECEKCNILPLCQGGCKSNKLQYGAQHRCTRIKQIKKELVKYYYDILCGNIKIPLIK